jgi:hypothetical protein
MTIGSNRQWDELCAITTELVPQYGSRPAAFAAACREHPELANSAIDPTGKPVVKGSRVVQQPQPSESVHQTGTARPWSEILQTLGCLKPGAGVRRVRGV